MTVNSTPKSLLNSNNSNNQNKPTSQTILAYLPLMVEVPRNRFAWPLALAAHGALVLILMLGASAKVEPAKPVLQAELWQSFPAANVPVVMPAPLLTDLPEPSTVQSVVEPVAVAAAVLTTAIATQAVKKAAARQTARSKVVPKTMLKLAPKPVAKAVVKSALVTESKQPPKRTLKTATQPLVKPLVKPVVTSVKTVDTAVADKAKAKADSDAKAIFSAIAAKEAARLQTLARMNASLAGSSPQPVRSKVQAAPVSAKDLGAGWGSQLKSCVQPHLRYSDASGANPRVEYRVQLNSAGSPTALNVTKPSGNDAFDVAVERALRRCDPFPRPASGEYPNSIVVGYRLQS
jgi:TonB family protein